jgi:hypothetical protein
LEHEVGDDSVENGSLVMKGLSGLPDTFLSSTESAKIFRSLWNGKTEKTKYDAATFLSLDVLFGNDDTQSETRNKK